MGGVQDGPHHGWSRVLIMWSRVRIMGGHVSIQILSVGGAAVIKAYTEQLPPRGRGRGIGSASKDQNPSQRIKIYHDQGRELIMLVADHYDDAPLSPTPRGSWQHNKKQNNFQSIRDISSGCEGPTRGWSERLVSSVLTWQPCWHQDLSTSGRRGSRRSRQGSSQSSSRSSRGRSAPGTSSSSWRGSGPPSGSQGWHPGGPQ